MNSTTFLLIRHGMCESVGERISGRLPGISLNEEGLEQALALAERLKSVPIQAIYASPMERTRETAEFLAKMIDVPMDVNEAFHEIDYGAWSGKTLAELANVPEWQQYNAFRSGKRASYGEWFFEMQVRAVRELGLLREKHLGNTVAVFTHCDVIRGILLHYLGAPAEFNLRIEIRPTSVSTVALGEWGPKVLGVNSF